MKLTEEDIELLKASGWCDRESQDCDWVRVEQIEKQILENQEIIENVKKLSGRIMCDCICDGNCLHKKLTEHIKKQILSATTLKQEVEE